MANALIVTGQIVIPAAELELAFARSSGPGGQNVNKVNSKAQLRWRFRESTALPLAIRRRFQERFASRITASGEVVVSSDTHREQARNTRECYDRLRAMIASTVAAPAIRRRTKPSRGAIENRLQSKRRQSQKKQNRRPPRFE
ncbi:MAG: alternative ribosome rescue aminoacyl-tRNA hydrolase ArfB [Planctomycetota bacterium]